MFQVRDCPFEQFKCSNGQCIIKDLVCNGKYDCDDESDESPYKCKVWILAIILTDLTNVKR